MTTNDIVSSSFRDPSGFLFYHQGSLFRQVNIEYREDYDRLMESGLYDALVEARLLIPHREVDLPSRQSKNAYKIIQPELLEYISYPYEWCFSQYKAAALATLEIQKLALEYDMSLKDASAYNIQFFQGAPVLIDTLSFEGYQEGRPWIAYRQFCQHFLAPLVLMSYTDVRLAQLLRCYIDGVPLDLASRILPWRTRFRFSLFVHIHLHARTQARYANKSLDKKKRAVQLSRRGITALLQSIESGVKRLRWKNEGTEWGDYYSGTNYDREAMSHKRQLVAEFLDEVSPQPRKVWDMGANTGAFSRIAASKGMKVISMDVDQAAVETNYLETIERKESCLLPLIVDLTNPSPAIGWAHEERMSLMQRGPADTVLALALVHHLAISNNLPLNKIASFFHRICSSLIIEFVPKSDSQVQRLLTTRKDIFPDYTKQRFEREFGRFFSLIKSEKVQNSERTLYLMVSLRERQKH